MTQFNSKKKQWWIQSLYQHYSISTFVLPLSEKCKSLHILIWALCVFFVSKYNYPYLLSVFPLGILVVIKVIYLSLFVIQENYFVQASDHIIYFQGPHGAYKTSIYYKSHQ